MCNLERVISFKLLWFWSLVYLEKTYRSRIDDFISILITQSSQTILSLFFFSFVCLIVTSIFYFFSWCIWYIMIVWFICYESIMNATLNVVMIVEPRITYYVLPSEVINMTYGKAMMLLYSQILNPKMGKEREILEVR